MWGLHLAAYFATQKENEAPAGDRFGTTAETFPRCRNFLMPLATCALMETRRENARLQKLLAELGTQNWRGGNQRKKC